MVTAWIEKLFLDNFNIKIKGTNYRVGISMPGIKLEEKLALKLVY